MKRLLSVATLLLMLAMPAMAQDILEWPGNMIIRPAPASIYTDQSILFQNKSGTRTYGLRLLEGTAPSINACGTATVTGLDGLMQVVITAGTPATCAVNLTSGMSYTTPLICWYMDVTTANGNGGKCVATATVVTITPATFTGAAANFGADTIQILVLGQK